VPGVERVGADVPDAHAVDRNPGGCGDLAVQPVELVVDGLGFPPGVSEDRAVDLGEDPFG
jgi:hypothetical protein